MDLWLTASLHVIIVIETESQYHIHMKWPLSQIGRSIVAHSPCRPPLDANPMSATMLLHGSGTPLCRRTKATHTRSRVGMNAMQTTGLSGRGFTLIELLVTIAIISLLLSILMPAMSAARQTAQSGACLSNLRRIGISCAMYLDRSEGRYPPMRLSTVDGSPYVNEYGAAQPRWQWFLAFELGAIITPPARSNAPWGDSYSRTMNNNYFICPSLTGPFARDIRNGAYGYNYQYLGNSRTDTAAPAYDHFPVSENQIKVPAETVVFADSRGADTHHGKHSYTLDPPRLARERNAARFGPGSDDGPIAHSPVEARHRGRAVTSHSDGHAELLSLNQLGYELGAAGEVVPVMDGAGASASNRLWNGRGADLPCASAP
jgi:prepilin-type N-terminal cleavage/methylation domain-containing protein